MDPRLIKFGVTLWSTDFLSDVIGYITGRKEGGGKQSLAYGRWKLNVTIFIFTNDTWIQIYHLAAEIPLGSTRSCPQGWGACWKACLTRNISSLPYPRPSPYPVAIMHCIWGCSDRLLPSLEIQTTTKDQLSGPALNEMGGSGKSVILPIDTASPVSFSTLQLKTEDCPSNQEKSLDKLILIIRNLLYSLFGDNYILK